jgi:hypothetical protein
MIEGAPGLVPWRGKRRSGTGGVFLGSRQARQAAASAGTIIMMRGEAAQRLGKARLRQVPGRGLSVRLLLFITAGHRL